MKYKLANETNASIAIIKQAQEKYGFTVRNSIHNLQPSDFLKMDNDAKIKFRDAFIEYSDLREEMKTTLLNTVIEQRFQKLEQAYTFLRKAYDIIGVDEVKNLNYNQTSIKRKLIALSDKSNSNKIARILNKSGIKANEFIPLVDAKNKLRNAYKLVKIDKQPKASDFNNYYKTETASKRLNGEIVHGLKIIREKFIFN